MTNSEVNLIIAKYMGTEDAIPVNIEELSDKQKMIYQPYAYDLNKMVDVMHKLSEAMKSRIYSMVMYASTVDELLLKQTMQRSVSVVLAETILELENETKN